MDAELRPEKRGPALVECPDSAIRNRLRFSGQAAKGCSRVACKG
ncbi:hypothetical protein GGQ71_001266 [Rhizobium taibaishanense]|uniref:Uncharacterized protein n=1 Tax=Allorhizobium taibaishanense TaxID=887144 RepID=A0A7W6HL53_9HYPH|nr:hypothetical protein [Allorhizobium taibaishanense]